MWWFVWYLLIICLASGNNTELLPWEKQIHPSTVWNNSKFVEECMVVVLYYEIRTTSLQYDFNRSTIECCLFMFHWCGSPIFHEHRMFTAMGLGWYNPAVPPKWVVSSSSTHRLLWCFLYPHGGCFIKLIPLSSEKCNVFVFYQVTQV